MVLVVLADELMVDCSSVLVTFCIAEVTATYADVAATDDDEGDEVVVVDDEKDEEDAAVSSCWEEE